MSSDEEINICGATSIQGNMLIGDGLTDWRTTYDGHFEHCLPFWEHFGHKTSRGKFPTLVFPTTRNRCFFLPTNGTSLVAIQPLQKQTSPQPLASSLFPASDCVTNRCFECSRPLLWHTTAVLPAFLWPSQQLGVYYYDKKQDGFSNQHFSGPKDQKAAFLTATD